MKERLSVPLACLLCLSPGLALAQDKHQIEPVPFHSISNEDLEGLLKRIDLDFEKLDEGAYKLDLATFVVILINNQQNLQLHAGFRSEDPLSLKLINEWNKSKRFSCAYLDDDNDPILESDLDLSGGATAGTIKEFLRTFRISVTAFAAFLNEGEGEGGGDRPAEPPPDADPEPAAESRP